MASFPRRKWPALALLSTVQFMVVLEIGFAFVPVSIAALAGVDEGRAGLASGLINTSWQIGGAVGIAVLSTLAASTTSDALAAGTPTALALTDGFQAALWGATAAAAAGLVVALTLIRRRELEHGTVAAAAIEAA